MVCTEEQRSNLGKFLEKIFSRARLVYALQGRGRDDTTFFSAMCLYQSCLDRMPEDTGGAMFLGGFQFTTSLGKMEDEG